MDANEKTLDDIKSKLLPHSKEEIDDAAIDAEDKVVLEEIMEANLVLKVLEKELKSQQDIAQKIFETMKNKVFRPVANRHTVVTLNAKPRLPSAARKGNYVAQS